MYCRIHVKGKIDDNALPVLVRCDGKHRTFCIRNFFKEKSSETLKYLQNVMHRLQLNRVNTTLYRYLKNTKISDF